VARRIAMRTHVALTAGAAVLLLAGCSGTGMGAGSGSPPASPSARERGTPAEISPLPGAARATGSTSDSVVTSSGATDEGPRIAWDARLNNSVSVSEGKLARFPGLAFAPVLPKFAVSPGRIDVSTDPAVGADGGLVELHYTFAKSPAFPTDGRVIVREQPVALAPGGLDGLATGTVPATAGKPLRVHGHLSLVRGSEGSFSLITVRGKALIVIAGPAISRAEVVKLAEGL
jgi:hypothetical protein